MCEALRLLVYTIYHTLGEGEQTRVLRVRIEHSDFLQASLINQLIRNGGKIFGSFLSLDMSNTSEY